MANEKNLKPFPKGVSGNPDGRPKLIDLSEMIHEEVGDEGMRAAIQALLKQAKKGNVKAIQELLDRGYGKVKQPLDHTSDGLPILQTEVYILPSLARIASTEKEVEM